VSVVAVGSVHGSPGVTTLVVALAQAWPRSGRRALLVEADVDGGVLAARLGLGHEPSLTDLGARARNGLSDAAIWDATQMLPCGVPAIVAHPSAQQCQAALRAAGGAMADGLMRFAHHDVLVDAGRLRPGAPTAMLDAATVTLLVLRPSLEQVDIVAHRLDPLNGRGNVALVLVGERPYRSAEVESALAIPVVGVVAIDRQGAARAGAAPSRGFARSPLARSVSTLVSTLLTRLDALAPPELVP
jgi:MinD-like ATPase involved in chromosome partitioning or flagellar assembly